MSSRWRLRIILTLASVLTAATWSLPAKAETLQYAANYLNRQQANITSGITHHLFFTPATVLPGSGNSVRMELTSSPGGTWCRVAGADLTALGVSNPPGATEGATLLPGVLSASCTIGNGVTTFDTITVSSVDPLSAGTKYGVAISDPGTAKLGTPPTQNSTKIELATNNGAIDIDQLLFYTTTISNDTVSISALVQDASPPVTNPSVQFSGLASPSATVTITRGGVSVATLTAGGTGEFSSTLSNQPTGQQSYTISALDISGAALAPVSFAFQLTAGTNTVVSGVFLGPSIGIDKTSVKLGQFVTISGSTAPSSSVTLTVNSVVVKSYTVSANQSGVWSKLVNTQDIGVGTHSASARSILGTSQVSAVSGTVAFAVNPLEQCDGKRTADSNCDGRVNLTDFSILLYFWQQTNPSNGRVDINGNSRVDVVDFSIMLFQWTG